MNQINYINGTATKLRTVRAYETGRNLIDYVEHIWDPEGTPLSMAKYDYTNDANLGLREQVDYTGRAFDDPTPAIVQTFGYNDRNELTSSPTVAR